MTNARYWLITGLLLAGLFAIQIVSALSESATIDEPTHLAAGVSYWRTGDFRLNPEHPALVKLLVSLPAVLAGAQLPTNDPSWEAADDFRFGSVFLYSNSLKPETLLFLGRLPIILLSVAFGLCLFVWTKRRFDSLAGLAVTAGYVFDPSVQAHGHLVTTDLAAALAFFGVIVVLDWYLKTPTIKRGWMLAIVFAVAQLVKFSLIVLWLIVPLVFLLRWWYDRKRQAPARWSAKKLFGLIGQLVLTTLVLSFISYGGELKKPIDDPNIATLYQKRAEIAAADPARSASTTAPVTRCGSRPVASWPRRLRT